MERIPSYKLAGYEAEQDKSGNVTITTQEGQSFDKVLLKAAALADQHREHLILVSHNNVTVPIRSLPPGQAVEAAKREYKKICAEMSEPIPFTRPGRSF